MAIRHPATTQHPEHQVRPVQPVKPVRSSPSPTPSFGAQAPTTQPLEPILFPKLRIYFADFPYLHYSID